MSSKKEEKPEAKEKEEAKLALEALEGELGCRCERMDRWNSLFSLDTIHCEGAYKKGEGINDDIHQRLISLSCILSTTIPFSYPIFFCSAEDDEFEEFDPAHWNKDSIEEETQQQWMESWDDDMDVSCLHTSEYRDAQRQIVSLTHLGAFFHKTRILSPRVSGKNCKRAPNEMNELLNFILYY